MSNSNSTTKRGHYLCKVGGIIDIYQKITMKKEANKTVTGTVEITLYHAKKALVSGFKSHKEAISKAEEILQGGMAAVNSLKKGGK